MIEKQSI